MGLAMHSEEISRDRRRGLHRLGCVRRLIETTPNEVLVVERQSKYDHVDGSEAPSVLLLGHCNQGGSGHAWFARAAHSFRAFGSLTPGG